MRGKKFIGIILILVIGFIFTVTAIATVLVLYVLNCIEFHIIALYYMEGLGTAVYGIVLYFIRLYCQVLCDILLYCIVLYCIVLYCIVFV